MAFSINRVSALHQAVSQRLFIIRAIQVFFAFCGMVSIAVFGSGYPLIGYFGFYVFVAVVGLIASAFILFVKHVKPTMIKADALMLLTVGYDVMFWLFWVIAASNLATYASMCAAGWGEYFPTNCRAAQSAAAFGKPHDC